MAKKIEKLCLRGKYDEVIELTDELYRQYIDSEIQQERVHAKLSLTWRTLSFNALAKHQEAILVCDQLIDIYTHSMLPEDMDDEYRKQMIRSANSDKARALYGLEEYDKAIKFIDSMMDEYFDCTDDLTEIVTITMLTIKDEILKAIGASTHDRLAVLNKISVRFQMSHNPQILDSVLSALIEMLRIFLENYDLKNALIIRQIAEQLDSSANKFKVEKILTVIKKFEVALQEAGIDSTA